MAARSEIILSNQTHPDGSTTESLVGERFKGDGYYGRSDGIHTVQYIYAQFEGTISIQGTLAVNPQEEDWFTIQETVSEIELESPPTSQSQSSIKNFTGNYVWVRVAVSNWTTGTINAVLLSH
jgi:hypothetical protein